MAEAEDGGPVGACEVDRQQRRVLADTIAAFAAEIERRWLARVETVLAEGRSDISPTELRDAVPDYLARLADALRGEQPMEQEGLAAWEQVASEHGVTRVRLGFDVGQLVREFILLRRVLFEVAREQNVIREDAQSQRLTDLIEAAIATSVRSYVESRDIADQRMQAEHIGFLTHELRNPLFTATMAATQLGRRPEVVAAAASTLDLLNRGLERMRTLIEGILLTQRMEAREIECRPVELTLEDVVPEASRAAELEAKNKGVEFVAQYDPSIHIRVDPLSPVRRCRTCSTTP
jgi:signal transduction histidine kinase